MTYFGQGRNAVLGNPDRDLRLATDMLQFATSLRLS